MHPCTVDFQGRPVVFTSPEILLEMQNLESDPSKLAGDMTFTIDKIFFQCHRISVYLGQFCTFQIFI